VARKRSSLRPLHGRPAGRETECYGSAQSDLAVRVPEEVGRRTPSYGRITRSAKPLSGNLHISESHRRQGIASWLLGVAADWLRLGHVDRLLTYAQPEQKAYATFLEHAGFHEITRPPEAGRLARLTPQSVRKATAAVATASPAAIESGQKVASGQHSSQRISPARR